VDFWRGPVEKIVSRYLTDHLRNLRRSNFLNTLTQGLRTWARLIRPFGAGANLDSLFALIHYSR